MAFTPTDAVVHVRFETVKQAAAFKAWLSNSGEQYFFESCEYSLDPEVSDNPPTLSDYHSHPNEVRFSTEKS